MLNLVLILFGIPWLLAQYVFRGKYRASLKQRLGFGLPLPLHKKVLWIHAVSLGEARAAAPLYHALTKAYPDTPIVISTTTETGQAEAQRSLPGAAAYFYLPLDISWIMRELMRRLQPAALILVEGDIWPNLLKAAKNQNVKLCLVNGKISEKSARRFAYFPSLAKRLFSAFDLLCVQNKTYKERFTQIGAPAEKIFVTGNLKYDASFPEIPLAEWKRALKIQPTDRILTLGSTHDPEEENILRALETIPHLKILLVPRHPERFEALSKRYPSTYSKRDQLTGEERVILIDAMGVLPACYQLSTLAIVGGSFVKHVGGHNILEPVQCGIPVLFGPHMEAQKEMAALVLGAKAGAQVSLAELPAAVNKILTTHSHPDVEHFALQLKGSVEKTVQKIGLEVKSSLC